MKNLFLALIFLSSTGLSAETKSIANIIGTLLCVMQIRLSLFQTTYSAFTS